MPIKLKKIRPVLLCFLLISMLASCYYDSEEFLYPQLSTSCDTTQVTYSGSIKPLLNMYCLTCHSQTSAPALGANINLEDFNGLKYEADHGFLMGGLMQKTGYSPIFGV